MLFKSKKNKANPYQIKNFTLFKKVVFFIKILLKNAKTGPQRVPPCRSLHLQLKIGISTCSKKNNLSGSAVFFPSFLNGFLIRIQ